MNTKTIVSPRGRLNRDERLGAPVPAPTAPPQLTAMAARREKLEAERAEVFATWKAALDEAGGNVSRAGETLNPPITHDRANYLTRRFGLVEYAASLRVAATGRAMGRPTSTATAARSKREPHSRKK